MRIIAIVTAVLVAALVITFWPRSNRGDELAIVAGSQATSTLDTSPFEFPQSDGPTTIPDAVLETTTSSTSTTTTIPIPTTTLPVPGQQSDPACQIQAEMVKVGRASAEGPSNPVSFARATSAQMDGWITTLEGLNEPDYQSAIGRLQESADQLRGVSSADQLRLAMTQILTPDPRMSALRDHWIQTCPDVIAAR